MEVILLIYVQEEVYGKRLLRYVLGKKNPYLHPELVTSSDMVTYRVGTETQKVVVLTDKEDIRAEGKKAVIHLTARQNVERNTIFRYQKAENIYKQLLLQLGMKEESNPDNLMKNAGQKRGIVFVLSPDAIGVTAMATLISQWLGQNGCCLYLNLTGFPIWFGESLCEEPDFQLSGVDELLFMSNREDFAEREKEIRRPMGQAFLLPPFHHYKDLLDSTKEDWHELFQRLQTDCGYDSIVVELGPLMEHTMDLLSLGNEIIFLSQKGLLGKVRFNVWKQYCRMEKKQELLYQTRRLLLPEEWQEWEEMILEHPLKEIAGNNQLMARVNELLEHDREGEEDVCLWEDFGGTA